MVRVDGQMLDPVYANVYDVTGSDALFNAVFACWWAPGKLHVSCALTEHNALIRATVVDYTGRSYDVLQRNCIHFAGDFCHCLQVKGLRGWIHSAQESGAP